MYSDKDKQKRKVAAYRKRKMELLRKMKTDKGCALCGYNRHPDALHFHHRSDKKDTISNMRKTNKGIDKIRAEMEDCVVLCANCHAIIHATLHGGETGIDMGEA